MKKFVASLLVAAVATMTGCNTSGPGGPGATGSSSRVSNYSPDSSRNPADTQHHVAAGDSGRGSGAPVLGGRDSFRLEGPVSLGGLKPSLTLKQGEKKEVTVTISRGSDFKQNVKLEALNPPKGLMVTFEKNTIGAGDKEAKVMIEAAKDAPLGTQEVDINGVPDSGPAPEKPLKLEVKVEKGGESK